MKKFITYISKQSKSNDLKKLVYIPMDGELKSLSEKRKAVRGHDFRTSFPIMCLLDDYAEQNAKIELICLMNTENGNGEQRNFEVLRQELQELASEIGFSYDIRVVSVMPDEVAEAHVHTFRSLIDLIDDDDELFACCTFGTKPIPIIEMMALNYAYRLKKNISVRSIVYGLFGWENDNDKGRIFDIKELFYMNQMVNQLAREGRPGSEELIRQLMSFDSE